MAYIYNQQECLPLYNSDPPKIVISKKGTAG